MIFFSRLPLTRLFQSGRICSSLLLLALLFSPPPAIASTDEDIRSEGAILYSLHCAPCHDPLEKELLSNRSASRIRSAIRYIPAMIRLRHLKDADLEAIAAVLAEPGAAER